MDKADYTSVVGEIFSGVVSGQQKIEINTNKNNYVLFLNQSPEITVDNIPKTRIKMGLDLQGGARALVQSETALTDAELDDLIQVSRNRFNVYGLSDVNIKAVSDLVGNKFMLVEVAGATPQDLEQLVAKQGKFEAKVGNTSVFVGGIGGEKDIADVCKNDAKCSGITQCGQSGTGYVCKFQFTVYLTEKARNIKGVILDTTSLPNQIHIPLTAWGRSGEEIDKQIKFLLVVDKLNSEPLFFRLLPGNIVDVSALSNTIAELEKYGLKELYTCLDAGFFSEDNIKEMYEKKIDFLTRLPSSRCLYKELIKEECGNIEAYANAVRYGERGLFVKQKEVELFGNKAYIDNCVAFNT